MSENLQKKIREVDYSTTSPFSKQVVQTRGVQLSPLSSLQPQSSHLGDRARASSKAGKLMISCSVSSNVILFVLHSNGIKSINYLYVDDDRSFLSDDNLFREVTHLGFLESGKMFVFQQEREQ